MLKIAVCVKQVPAGKAGMNYNTGNIERSKSGGMLNMYDYGAVETALRIKDQMGAEVDVFTMGPPKAEEVLREVKALGVDKMFLISDRAFSGSDVLATSYTISHAIAQQDEYDLIICGRQTTDGDTAQVSGSIAAWLGYTYLPWADEILEINEEKIKISSLMDKKHIVFEAGYPCVISVEPGIYTVRAATLKNKLSSRKTEISVLGNEQLGLCEERIGQKGSATKVKKVEFREVKDASEIMKLEADEFIQLVIQETEKI